jgi:uncharacterized protein with HEPN domain
MAEISLLQSIAARLTLSVFRTDPIVRHAAAYEIQTISEAVRQIPDDWLADFPTEPWGQIKRIGDRIRHEYFRIDDAILWQVITTDAPALEMVLRTMLKRHAGGGRIVRRGRCQPDTLHVPNFEPLTLAPRRST